MTSSWEVERNTVRLGGLYLSYHSEKIVIHIFLCRYPLHQIEYDVVSNAEDEYVLTDVSRGIIYNVFTIRSLNI